MSETDTEQVTCVGCSCAISTGSIVVVSSVVMGSEKHSRQAIVAILVGAVFGAVLAQVMALRPSLDIFRYIISPVCARLSLAHFELQAKQHLIQAQGRNRLLATQAPDAPSSVFQEAPDDDAV